MEGTFRDLDAVPPSWRLGFDGKALLEAFVGTVVGLIALFLPMTTSTSPTANSRSSSNGAPGSSLSPFRSFLRMLNRRRDPAAEQRRMQLEKEFALLDWMHSEIDLIEAGLPSDRTTGANSSDC